jgi:hypothetical protein
MQRHTDTQTVKWSYESPGQGPPPPAIVEQIGLLPCSQDLSQMNPVDAHNLNT